MSFWKFSRKVTPIPCRPLTIIRIGILTVGVLKPLKTTKELAKSVLGTSFGTWSDKGAKQCQSLDTILCFLPSPLGQSNKRSVTTQRKFSFRNIENVFTWLSRSLWQRSPCWLCPAKWLLSVSAGSYISLRSEYISTVLCNSTCRPHIQLETYYPESVYDCSGFLTNVERCCSVSRSSYP